MNIKYKRSILNSEFNELKGRKDRVILDFVKKKLLENFNKGRVGHDGSRITVDNSL